MIKHRKANQQMAYKVAGRAKDGTKILQQQRPVTRKGTITMAQARRIIRKVKAQTA